MIFGCIRDIDDIARMPIGVIALASTPRKSIKKGQGDPGIPVKFAGVAFKPNEWLDADREEPCYRNRQNESDCSTIECLFSNHFTAFNLKSSFNNGSEICSGRSNRLPA